MSEPLENFEELGRRAVACKRWRWMPGMLVVYPPSVSAELERKEWPFKGIKVTVHFRHTERDEEPYTGTRPDLTDPATLGCLLALVREAWGRGVYLLPDGGWYVKGARLKDGASVNLGICAASEEEALVAALEAAP